MVHRIAILLGNVFSSGLLNPHECAVPLGQLIVGESMVDETVSLGNCFFYSLLLCVQFQ